LVNAQLDLVCYTTTMLVTIDTGGTKTLIASFGEDGHIGETLKFPTPRKTDEYIDLLRNTLEKTYGHEKVEAIVIALPGVVEDGVAVWCANLGWRDFDVRAALSGVLGGAPILIENDANLAGLAEARALHPVPLSVLYVTVSTGIGTGIITEGRIDPAFTKSEGGHMLVEFDGVVRGWETFASGKAIYAAYETYARDITSEHIWDQIADRISRGFLAIIPLLQPKIIIIGGSIGTYYDQYGKKLETILDEKLPVDIARPPIQQAKNPETAVLYGCYYHALNFLSHN
jgi:predicted NBD/HSP70 family sugar kinase